MAFGFCLSSAGTWTAPCWGSCRSCWPCTAMKPGLRYAPLDFHRLHLMHSSCYCNDTLQMPACALHFAGGGGSFFYCSTAPEALLFQVGCDCCFCWSGLSFWTGTENEETGMKCIDFLKHIYNVFQYTLIKDTTSEDHGLLFIPFTRLRTCCTLCNKDSDQSSCFCCNSSKLIGFITWSTGRVWNMLWGNKGSGNTFYKYVNYIFRMFLFSNYFLLFQNVSPSLLPQKCMCLPWISDYDLSYKDLQEFKRKKIISYSK